MPRLGETMERGIVAEWLVAEGEAFKRGDGIIEFETDKTAVEYPALGAGVLTQQLVQAGDEVEVGAPIALIDIGNGPDWVSEEYQSESFNQQIADVGAGSQDIEVPSSSEEIQRQRRATPVARKLARQAGVALQAMIGTGRRGRIEAQDVKAFLESSSQPALSSASAFQDHASQFVLYTPEKQYANGIAYTVSGPLTGPRYLLIHGFAADASAWSLLSRALIKAGCCVVSVDLPGHGDTQTEAQDTESLHVGLQSVLDEVGEKDQPWHIVAHSLGASPALALAQMLAGPDIVSRQVIPVRTISSLSLVCPIGLGLSIDEKFVRGMAKPSSSGELSHLLRRLSERPSTLTAHAVDELYTVLRQGRLVRLAESMLGVHGQSVDHHAAIRGLSKQLPTRIIVGHADRITAWQDVLQVAPTVGVHHFPGAGHMPHWDYPSEVAEILLAGQ